MEDIIETNDYCTGITSFEGELYLLLTKEDNLGNYNVGTFILKDNEIILSDKNVTFDENSYIPYIDKTLSKDDELYYTWTHDDVVNLHYKDKIINMEGTPYFFLTIHKGYVYTCGGIDGLWLRRIKIFDEYV